MDKTTSRPHFLLTNDDGIQARGLKHLYEGIKNLGDVTIVAPSSQKSGASQSLTLGSLNVTSVDWEDNVKAYQVSGTPVDCVRAALQILNCKPTMILSGVNLGHNLGRTLLFSGTCGAVIEGVYSGIPGAAFSYFREDQDEYDHVEKYIAPIVEYLLDLQIPSGTFYNINFPEHLDEEIKGFKVAPHGISNWSSAFKPSEKIESQFISADFWKRHDKDIDSDCHFNELGYITASPIQISELTDFDILQKQKDSFEAYVSNKFRFNS